MNLRKKIEKFALKITCKDICKKAKNFRFDKNIMLITILPFYIIYISYKHHYIDDATYISILSIIAQLTVSLIGVLFIIAIFKIQLLNLLGRNDEIESTKNNMENTVLIGLGTILSAVISMYCTLKSKTGNDVNNIIPSVVVLWLFFIFLMYFCYFYIEEFLKNNNKLL